MVIPTQLQKPDFRFVLLGKWSSWKNKKTGEMKNVSPEDFETFNNNKEWYPLGKSPFEKEWQKKGYKFDDPKLLNHIKSGGNYGIIGGYGNLIILDKDSEKLPIDLDTFCIKTGSGGKHYYILSDYPHNHVFVNEMGELRANNYQVVGAGSTHPNGNKYEVLKNLPIKQISKNELGDIIEPYLRNADGDMARNYDMTSEIKKLIQGKDTSRSGLEYRRAVAEFRKEKSREKVKKLLMAYKKFADSPEQYQELTLDKAESFVLKEQEQTQTKEIPVTEETLRILNNPNLFEIINQEFEKQITGEEKSRKAIFLSLCSVWVKNTQIPLNTFVSSASSAGKSYICKKITNIFPKELIEYRSKISGEAFTYWHTNEPNWSWDGKICYLEDIKQDVLDSSTFKIMCSEGSVATVVKNQKAIDLIVNGKPCILITTAGTNPSSEVLNRFSIAQLDESSKQTHNITLNQAMELKEEEYNPKITAALNSLQRVKVTVPFAPEIHNFITQNYSWNDVRMRRDFSRLRDLIKCSVALHQHQRKKNEKGELIGQEKDYEIARECINYIKTTTLKGLTHKLKKAYDFCIKEGEFTATNIHSKHPIVSQAMWYRYLDDLCERDLLKTELRDTEQSKKRVTYYIVQNTTSFDLPSFKELQKYSRNDTTDINNINDTIDINDKNNSIKYINSTVNSTKKPNKWHKLLPFDHDKEDYEMEGKIEIRD